jgi:hypothetical protein
MMHEAERKINDRQGNIVPFSETIVDKNNKILVAYFGDRVENEEELSAKVSTTI